jgi:hypothetical protein
VREFGSSFALVPRGGASKGVALKDSLLRKKGIAYRTRQTHTEFSDPDQKTQYSRSEKKIAIALKEWCFR